MQAIVRRLSPWIVRGVVVGTALIPSRLSAQQPERYTVSGHEVAISYRRGRRCRRQSVSVHSRG